MQNPLSSDMNVLRPSLLPGLLDALRHNIARKNNDVAFFEIGRVFSQSGNQIREERRLGVDPDRAAFFNLLERRGPR